MDNIEFWLTGEQANALVNFAKVYIDMEGVREDLKHALCKKVKGGFEVLMARGFGAAKLILSVDCGVTEGESFLIRIPSKTFDKKSAVKVTAGEKTTTWDDGSITQVLGVTFDSFPDIEGYYWKEREESVKIWIDPEIFANVLKRFDKKSPVMFSITNKKEPIYIQQGKDKSKRAFILPVNVREYERVDMA